MSYADTLLAAGERIVRREHQHWFVLLWTARYAVLAILAGIVLFFLGGALGTDGAAGTVRMVAGWITLIY